MSGTDAGARVRDAFLAACRLDVAVRKPGNVSVASPGHGMDAAQFLASAEAAAGPLAERCARVGARIEGAVAATLAVAGCNTNLGIVLLAAPIAAAAERAGPLREAIGAVLDELDLDDARAAYRAIARADPGGLGRVEAEDVHAAPGVGLREAMRLAAGRDRIAAQYADGFADLFDTGLPALRGATTPADVQRVYLAFLARWPDSHIVRKFNSAVAQTVLNEARHWVQRLDAGPLSGTDEAAFAAWDESLKARGLNPGTSADLTVATLMLDALLRGQRTR
ncbi:MAG TPA: triphosphoribosyl-dephospho-CoA synthase, partial [Ideonella sp.]|nr:triphosphoribosyl-dephospho-CoA synthase [Ideonella sp.]